MTHCWVNLFSRPHRFFSRNPLLTAWVLDLVKGASRWVLSRNKRNQPHQLWQQPRGWRWGLLVWDNWCVSYTTIAPLSWPAVSLYAAFWFSASPKAFSAVTTWQPVLCFVGRSSGQTHHGREKQPVIFPHMVLSLDAETSFFETIKVLLDDLIWMISLIIMLQYPQKSSTETVDGSEIPRPTTSWDVFQTLFLSWRFNCQPQPVNPGFLVAINAWSIPGRLLCLTTETTKTTFSYVFLNEWKLGV